MELMVLAFLCFTSFLEFGSQLILGVLHHALEELSPTRKIDEFDKMSRNDYAVLLSLMESGKVTETKYHRRREEHMDVWVFATANTLTGIPTENISRFKPYIFHFREYTLDEYLRVVVKVLTEESRKANAGRTMEADEGSASKLSAKNLNKNLSKTLSLCYANCLFRRTHSPFERTRNIIREG